MIKVLTIDDDDTLLFIMKRFLTKTGKVSEIRIAGNGQQGLQVLEDENWVPDLIFLDINMPVMNGWDFLEVFSRTKSEKFKGKIVMLSSSTMDIEVDDANKHSLVFSYMSKPAEYFKLLELVEEIDSQLNGG